MNIVMLVSNAFTHDPRVRNEARSLVEGGHNVTVVAWDRAGEAPPRETIDGVEVIRLRNTPGMDRLRYDLFRLRGWWRLATRAVFALHAEHPVEAVHCHDLDTLPTGVRVKRRLGIPLVFDAHEIWGNMVARGLPAAVGVWFRAKERRLLSHVDRMVVENEPMRAYYRRLGRDRFPVAIVMNAKPVFVDDYVAPQNAPTQALYIGTLNESRFLLGSLEAVSGLDDIELVIGGIGKPAYVTRLSERAGANPNARFIGRVPSDEVLPLTLKTDIVLCLTDPADPNNRIATANKQFEALSTGRPIIVSEGTFLAEFTLEHDVGIAVPHTVQGVRDGLRRLQNDPALRERLGRNALATAKNGFDWPAQKERLLEMYQHLGPQAADQPDASAIA